MLQLHLIDQEFYCPRRWFFYHIFDGIFDYRDPFVLKWAACLSVWFVGNVFTNPEVNWNEVLYMLSPWIFYHQFDLVCRIIWIKPLLSTYITNIYKNNKRLMVLPILYNSREYLPKKERRMWWNTYPAIRIHVRVSSLTYKNFVMDLFL